MKMKINSENYGRFIVDYYDGQLSAEQKRALLRFLEQHPELKREFDSFADTPVLEGEDIRFPEKLFLKHTEIKKVGRVDEENYPRYFVLAQDGELAEDERRQLDGFLQQNPFLKKEYDRFALARLSPDKTVVFENKAQLKKRPAAFWWPYVAGAAAAMLLLLAGLQFLFPGAAKPENSGPHSAIHPLAGMSVEKSLAGDDHPKPKLKTWPARKEKTPPERKTKPKRAKQPVMPLHRYKPVKMLASAGIYNPVRRQDDYFPLMFPKAPPQTENLALSLPVVVEKPVRRGFFRKTVGKPFAELAAVFAMQKRKRKTAGNPGKGFVKVLERGVSAMNALTDRDMVMVKTYDADGNLIDYQLLSDNISINHPVKSSR